ncbi:MAG: preprotein translocase subunit SecD, partial [Ilumatobacteraceae bacterium]
VDSVADTADDSVPPTGSDLPPASEFADVAAQPISSDPNDPTASVIVQNIDGTEIYQLGPAFATGEVFNSDATADIIQGGWGVRVTLKRGSGGEDLWNIGASQCFSGTGSCPTRRMAIVLDGVVQSAPTVNQPSFSGGVDITGNFKESEAKDLARVLKSGALPVRLEVQAVQTVSPTLGEDSLRATLVAGLIGIALVLLFMILYYRTLAIVVVGGLVVSGGILWNVITFLSASSGLALSLAGAAGIIVSVGITIDSYVVFFEKLKDEVKAGRTLRNSAERGFKSTWRTIVAADTVSLLAAFTLWYLTVGSVRGFAFFLGLATLTDLVVAWFFTRPAMMLLARSGRVGRRGAFGIKVAPGGAS